MKDVSCFKPNVNTDENFAKSLMIAAREGVTLLAYDATIREDEIVLGNPVPILLKEKCEMSDQLVF